MGWRARVGGPKPPVSLDTAALRLPYGLQRSARRGCGGGNHGSAIDAIFAARRQAAIRNIRRLDIKR